jgi:hypothetical protein
MLRGWTPGVTNWTQALDTPAVRQLHFIKKLLYSHPYLNRIPDQSLVLAGQGTNVATRVQVTRDGTTGHSDATYLMAYLSSPHSITLDTGVIRAQELNVYWFDPATGTSELVHGQLANPGKLTVEKRPPADGVVVIEETTKNHPGSH